MPRPYRKDTTKDTLVRSLIPFVANVIRCSPDEAMDYLLSLDPEARHAIYRLRLERNRRKAIKAVRNRPTILRSKEHLNL